jgi:hypothetical protein
VFSGRWICLADDTKRFMKKKFKFFALKKKKHLKLSKETQGVLGSFVAIATITAIGSIFQFARSDQEFADIDALLNEVGASTEVADSCNAAIDLAESTKRQMFRPYRLEITAMTQDMVNVGVAAFRDIRKDIPRSEWSLMAVGANNLRRLAVGRGRIDSAIADRQRQLTEIHNSAQNRIAELNGQEFLEAQPINGNPTAVPAIPGELQQAQARITELTPELDRLIALRERLDRERNDAQNLLSGKQITMGLNEGARGRERRLRIFERQGQRCTSGRPIRGRMVQVCEAYRSYTELETRITDLNTRIPEVETQLAAVRQELAEKTARVSELNTQLTAIRARFEALRTARLEEDNPRKNALTAEVAALQGRLNSVDAAQEALERQLNYRGQVFFGLLRNAHEAGCRRDHFLNPLTLSQRYGREFAQSTNADGSIPMVGDCLNYSEAAYNRHDGMLQVCRILPRVPGMEGEVVRQAGIGLVADSYRSCVQIDIGRIDDSFFTPDGRFNLARVREILIPTEDWVDISNRTPGHLAYDVIDVVSEQLPTECRDLYFERRFRVPATPAATPVEAPTGVVSAPDAGPQTGPNVTYGR